MSAVYNDGTVQYGSKVLTINTVDYVADNITVNRPTKAIDRTNNLGEPSGSAGIPDFVTGSCTLQLASGTTAEPANGLTFTATFDAGIGAETFYLTSVSRALAKDSEVKLNVNFKKKYN